MTAGLSGMVVISSASVLHAAWRDALPGASVFGPSVDLELVRGASVAVLDLPTLSALGELVAPADTIGATRCIWLHSDIEPADLVKARSLGVTHTAHRSGGLASVLTLLVDDDDQPRASVIGRIRDPGAIDRLTAEELLLLRRLGAGATVAQLREATGWSRYEVERLRVAALGKLGAQTTGEALLLLRLSATAEGTPAAP